MYRCFYLTLTLLLFLIEPLAAQNDRNAPSKPVSNWSGFERGVRFGLGVHENIYGELGFSWHKYHNDTIRQRAFALYSTLEMTPTLIPSDRQVYGFKLGTEYTHRFLAAGFETKLQTNGIKQDVVFTPKIGLCIHSSIIFYYGYNISVNDYPYDFVGDHQLSLVFTDVSWK